MAGVQIEGLNRFITTARRAGADLDDIREAHRHAAQYVMPYAMATAPKLTGAAAATTRVSATARAGTIKVGSRGLPYPGRVHWGDPRPGIHANPWLTRAAQTSEPIWISAYTRELNAAVLSVKGK
ncbi:hypothetical protein [Kocuria sp.]|uniref:hypothetical protein n=1 Tax=Kocuria sp. TaxID=1871328 RepID=UPI0026DFBC20|nr:hypothetical protein [Kocuria sp.]MDO5618021.1 hypothetical protein [Kocuria sp.]